MNLDIRKELLNGRSVEDLVYHIEDLIKNEKAAIEKEKAAAANAEVAKARAKVVDAWVEYWNILGAPEEFKDLIKEVVNESFEGTEAVIKGLWASAKKAQGELGLKERNLDDVIEKFLATL